MVRLKEKSASRLKKDPTWKCIVQVDFKVSEKTHVYLKCNYFDNVVKWGMIKMKECLSKPYKNIAYCVKFSEEMKEEICAYMKKTIIRKHLV